ncbi:MAG: cob(I)yrinic acid a,c-diamide adenosyltransferase [bacterium]|nr:MAG: cob(I)yrinic acid a,c-diamide adenosyltransferase [bacterium]
MRGIGRGYIHVYTGTGKGKTTASLGLALRAVGRGLRVLVVQFLKAEKEYTGERSAAESLGPALEIRARGTGGFVFPGEVPPEASEAARSALGEVRSEMEAGRWDIIVLDEINVASSLGMIPTGDLLALLDAKPDGVELVLTGRNAPREVLERADLVTEMREVKHYYGKGVAAREGIEK